MLHLANAGAVSAQCTRQNGSSHYWSCSPASMQYSGSGAAIVTFWVVQRQPLCKCRCLYGTFHHTSRERRTEQSAEQRARYLKPDQKSAKMAEITRMEDEIRHFSFIDSYVAIRAEKDQRSRKILSHILIGNFIPWVFLIIFKRYKI